MNLSSQFKYSVIMNFSHINKVICSIIISIVVIFGNYSEATAESKEKNNAPTQTYSCNVISEFLYDCDEFKCVSTIPNKGIDLKQEIKGLNEDGLCVHEQETPDGNTVICKYGKESRKFISLSINRNKPDLLGAAQPDPREQVLMMDIFNNECQIIVSEENKGKVERIEINRQKQNK